MFSTFAYEATLHKQQQKEQMCRAVFNVLYSI